jgi:hypothetical protein
MAGAIPSSGGPFGPTSRRRPSGYRAITHGRSLVSSIILRRFGLSRRSLNNFGIRPYPGVGPTGFGQLSEVHAINKKPAMCGKAVAFYGGHHSGLHYTPLFNLVLPLDGVFSLAAKINLLSPLMPVVIIQVRLYVGFDCRILFFGNKRRQF